MRSVLHVFALLTLGCALANCALAVEAARWAERFALVGIISEDTPGQTGHGIVVLRDRTTKRTLTLRGGATLPDVGNVRVGSIRHKKVVLTDGANTVELTYADLDTPTETVTISPPVSFGGGSNGNYLPQPAVNGIEPLPRIRPMAADQNALPSDLLVPRAAFPSDDYEDPYEGGEGDDAVEWFTPH